MRGTLHLAPAEDLNWLLPVLGQPLIATTARRRRELGLDDDTYQAGLRVILETLGEAGASTREELSGALSEAGLPHGYSIERYTLFLAALEGRICLGPDRGDAPGASPTYVSYEEWLGRRPAATPTGRDLREAHARLARRYLQAFAPAALADYSAWSGLNIGELREGWDALAGELVELEIAGRTLFALKEQMDGVQPPAASPIVRLLPAFDTYILGHRTRELVADKRYAARLSRNGMVPAAIMVDGRIQGIWRTNRKGRRVAVTLEPFEPLGDDVEGQIEVEIADINRFVGE
jgi:hypothetical protein